MANEYLKRTNTSVANKKVFTYSFWMKGNDIKTSSQARPIYNYDGGSGLFQFFVERSTNTNPGYWVLYGSGSVNIRWEGTRIDPSAWYHIVLSINTTKTQSVDRTVLYVNGVRINVLGSQSGSPGTPGFPTLNAEQYLGANYINGIGGNSRYQLSDYYYVDGQALTPDVFGFYKEEKGYQSSGTTRATDFRPGQWVPHSPRTIKNAINRTGGFGVNGFYLPMNDSSNVGADFHMTPNSIIKLKGEDLPQPRNGAPTTTDAYVSQLREDPYAANLVLAVPGISLENTNPELITNGTFDTNTTGWTTHANSISSVVDGVLRARSSSGDLHNEFYQNVTTVVGTRYTVSATVKIESGGQPAWLWIDGNSVVSSTSTSYVTISYDFTATSTTTKVGISERVNSDTFYDNISLKVAMPVRDYSADIKGSGTNKTLTAVGEAGVGYEIPSYYGSAMRFGNDGTNGAGNTDIINVPTSSDFVFNGDVTIECWMYVKSTPTTSGAFLGQWQSGGGTNRNLMMYIDTSNRITSYFNSGGTNYNTGASPALGLNQWHHIVTEKDGSNFRLYVNGVCVRVNNNIPTAGNTSAVPFTIGAETESGGSEGADYGIDGYIQDVRVYKGVAKYKGGFDVPKPYSPIGIESWRQVPDTCKNNFATWNAVDIDGSLVDGNLKASTGTSGSRTVGSTFGISSGKYYTEFYINSLTESTVFIGVVNTSASAEDTNLRIYQYNDAVCYSSSNGNKIIDGTSSAYGATYTNGDLIGVSINLDTNEVTFFKNGTSQGTITTKTFTGHYEIMLGSGSSLGSQVVTANFGQNPTFSGQTTAGTYTDSNGKGLFKYQPPAGYLALCEDNLPTPAIANPGEHFKCVLWTGVNDTNKIKCGFQPDFVWIKNRDYQTWHSLYDTIRGPYLELNSNQNSADRDRSSNDGLRSFDSDGFTSGLDDNAGGRPGDSYVAWCWKAGGPAVSNTDGSITSQVSANQTAGFSIVSYTVSGTSAYTTGHGLSQAPEFIIWKSRSRSASWSVYHKDIGNSNVLRLDTNAVASSSGSWNSTTPTSSVVSHGGYYDGDNIIYYAWHGVEGYSKFGSYVGNGNADGPFVYCGFKPAWVMVKNIDDTGGRDWGIQDSSRASSNPCNKQLKANQSEVENSGLASSTFQIDMLSNGFKVINNTGIWNNDGETIIFMAFAESPFQTANAK